MSIENLLESISAKDLSGGSKAWGGKKLCPYTNPQLEYFVNQTGKQLDDEKSRYDIFLRKFHSQDQQTKDRLRGWIKSTFAEKIWAKGIGVRPNWTWKHILQNINDPNIRKSYLDVGSCHGIHGIVHFKEVQKANFDFYACELLPAYLKLQTLCGIDARMWHSHLSNIKDIFKEERFDLITCTEVLEHLTDEDSTRLLNEFQFVAKPKGTIFITYPVDAAVKKTNLKADPLGHRHQPVLKNVISRLGNDFEIQNQSTKIKSGNHEQQVIIAIKK